MGNQHHSAILELADKILSIEASALEAARLRLNGEFVDAVNLILSRCPPGRVAISGIGKSGLIGRKIAATLASTGTPSFFVHPTEAAHGDLGVLTLQDVVLTLSNSGKTSELFMLIPYLKRHGIPLIALTGQKNSPLAEVADIWLDGTVAEEACPLGLVPTASTTTALALGDALALCLLNQRGFKSEDFAMTHPSGVLGRRLLVHVRDLMSKGDALPKVTVDTTIRDTLVEMSRCGIGMTAVVGWDGKLCGVFTDGDLRRALDQNIDILITQVSKVMSLHPKTIRDNQLAAAAADLMQSAKINGVLVVDHDNNLVGALNMRMLLSAGVV